MCLACSFPTADGHWSDAGAVAGGLGPDRMLDLLRRLLANESLSIRRVAPRAGFLVTTPSGRAARATTIDDVWPVVQLLTGRTIDPLLSAPQRSDGAGQ
ncbi:hypothetical protein [Lichenifustis flavocetrariae]|nr:hypothetical protein [Lichenifustis flavocetrariae]